MKLSGKAAADVDQCPPQLAAFPEPVVRFLVAKSKKNRQRESDQGERCYRHRVTFDAESQFDCGHERRKQRHNQDSRPGLDNAAAANSGQVGEPRSFVGYNHWILWIFGSVVLDGQTTKR